MLLERMVNRELTYMESFGEKVLLGMAIAFSGLFFLMYGFAGLAGFFILNTAFWAFFGTIAYYALEDEREYNAKLYNIDYSKGIDFM